MEVFLTHIDDSKRRSYFMFLLVSLCKFFVIVCVVRLVDARRQQQLRQRQQISAPPAGLPQMQPNRYNLNQILLYDQQHQPTPSSTQSMVSPPLSMFGSRSNSLTVQSTQNNSKNRSFGDGHHQNMNYTMPDNVNQFRFNRMNR